MNVMADPRCCEVTAVDTENRRSADGPLPPAATVSA